MSLLDLFFPKRCLGCLGEGSWLCADCQMKVAMTASLEKVSDSCYALYPFELAVIRELLHHLKYNGIFELAEQAVGMTARWLPADELRRQLGETVLVPVPISNQRRKMRGYNQAELLARGLGNWLHLPVLPRVLVKKKGATLVGKSAEERLQAAMAGFALGPEAEQVLGKPLVLVDDVMTTGSTLKACRSLLEEVTHVPVKALVLARKH